MQALDKSLLCVKLVSIPKKRMLQICWTLGHSRIKVDIVDSGITTVYGVFQISVKVKKTHVKENKILIEEISKISIESKMWELSWLPSNIM